MDLKVHKDHKVQFKGIKVLQDLKVHKDILELKVV